MKKIIKLIRRWRYRRLFSYWYRYYAKRCDSVDVAYHNADDAFFWLGPFMHYHEWAMLEYYGVRSKSEEQHD